MLGRADAARFVPCAHQSRVRALVWTDAASDNASLQYRWLRRHLATVNRSATPWLVVMMHAPWYNSNVGHIGEAEPMRVNMERLLYDAQVDLVLAGHVHAYERTRPVYDGCVDSCGPVYLNLGDGGNREGAYVPWLTPQPRWSAFRQATFGVGMLTLHNATHAWYEWTRAACYDSAPGAHHHANFDAADCATAADAGAGESADNAEHPRVASDGVWIVRSAATRSGGSAPCVPAACRPDALPTNLPPLWSDPDESDACVDEEDVRSMVAGAAVGGGVGGFIIGIAVALVRLRGGMGAEGGRRGVGAEGRCVYVCVCVWRACLLSERARVCVRYPASSFRVPLAPPRVLLAPRAFPPPAPSHLPLLPLPHTAVRDAGRRVAEPTSQDEFAATAQPIRHAGSHARELRSCGRRVLGIHHHHSRCLRSSCPRHRRLGCPLCGACARHQAASTCLSVEVFKHVKRMSSSRNTLLCLRMIHRSQAQAVPAHVSTEL